GGSWRATAPRATPQSCGSLSSGPCHALAMNQPWGLSGPQFLEVYGAATAAVIVIPLLARQVTRWLPAGRRDPGAGGPEPAQAGYLAGGPRRAAEVIVAELGQAGALRVSNQ